jgi:hypothetical protein
MQTFLPYPDYAQSAKVLDRKRLGKQRVECMQIYNALTSVFQIVSPRSQPGWTKHPAVKMWRGHEGALLSYAVVVCDEWISRGYQDKQKEWFLERAMANLASCDPPVWFGNEAFHASHRSNLLRKDPEWYGKFGWVEPNNLPYIWPSKG